MVECVDCGYRFDPDEEGLEHEEYGWLCSGCWRDKYTYWCCFCETDEEALDAQHAFLVVFEEVSGVTPGLYRIVATPYWANGMICADLYPWALERIGDLPAGYTENSGGYPCGHLCVECQRKYCFSGVTRG